MTQPTLINVSSNEYAQGLRYYPFAVNLDRCTGSWILLMIYVIEYVFQTNRRFRITCF